MLRQSAILILLCGFTVIFSSCEKDPIQEDLINHASEFNKPNGFSSGHVATPPADDVSTKPVGYEEGDRVKVDHLSTLRQDGYSESALADKPFDAIQTRENGFETSDDVEEYDGIEGLNTQKPDGYEVKDKKEISNIPKPTR
jgi:hypothetical protein